VAGKTAHVAISKHHLEVPMELLTEKIAAPDISGWRENQESALIVPTKKIAGNSIAHPDYGGRTYA
jgi:hypothetical protein